MSDKFRITKYLLVAIVLIISATGISQTTVNSKGVNPALDVITRIVGEENSNKFNLSINSTNSDSYTVNVNYSKVHISASDQVAQCRGAYESILLRVFKNLGLSQKDIDEYFTGWDGPLPNTFFDNPVETAIELFNGKPSAYISSYSAQQKKEEKLHPVGVEFKKETIMRLGASGDNWCITWTKDGSQIVSMCDGNWLKLNYGGFHNHLFRINGNVEDFQREDIPNYPDFSGEEGSWFGYGIVSVDNDLYSVISKTPGTGWSGPFTGIKLLKSPDNGFSWYRIDQSGKELFIGPKGSMRNVVNNEEMFFLEEFGIPHKQQLAYPFSFVDFVQNGQNNSAAKDGFIYIYSPEGAHSNKLALARVPKEKIGNRGEWQYFTNYDGDNQAQWSDDIAKRGYTIEYPEKSSKGHYFGWYSWLPSVVWNEGLGVYIMVNGGTYAGHGMSDSDKDYYDGWMHSETGSLGFWYSDNPDGPWKQFYYTDYWIADHVDNRTYQPKLSPKWISEDGTEMILIWSDAMNNEKGQSHTVNYIWNQMKITILVK